ncbi:hypothetical protein L3Q72_09225 [Vibrio sp. JC009]|uniref:COG3014 family protein n=1 Tax=Vibrio sp. JC009 TaxID=2912314 RepID=UPI0023AF51AB|nr:hypothetical protein [Vibrio sp. JC009]WED20824.1 hypothetical protein L3Q72_09225 [Vibrio sp. JC009]
MKNITRLAFISLSTAVISACANMSAGNMFSHYSAQNNAVYSAVQSGQYQEAEELLPDSTAGDILDNMEKGRVTFLNQAYPSSLDYFEQSEIAVREQQDQAVVSVSESLNSVGALAVNDNLQSYSPADYELGFLHLYLGLNYLQSNSLEGALVEVRKANQVQERAKQKRQDELDSAEQEMKSNGMSASLGSVLSQYPDAGKTLQATQNGYLFYLSALLYETANELNDAYIDYKRALAVLPQNRQVAEGAIRVAKKLGMSQDLAKLRGQYQEPAALSADEAQIIVIDEQGTVFARDGWQQSLPIYGHKGTAFYTLALPYYPNQVTERYNSLKLDDKTLSESKLVDVNLMARQDLTERMPAMVMRQALRLVMKEQIRREATNGDELGNLLFNVWNILTEQPDTRSWQTLPAEVYSSSMVVPAGEHQLDINGRLYDISVKGGRTALVWISRQGEGATVWHKQLGTL